MKKIKLLRDRSAIETIEASYTIPIAMMMMIAIVNLGLVVFAQQSVEQAARQGARMGSVAQNSAAYYASSSAQSAIETSGIIQNPSVKILSASGAPGSILKVQVSGSVPSFFGALVPGLPDTFVVTGKANFRQEGWQ